MIAVAVVVVFHLWPAALPGGFVGVDVFLVISGYLITRIITTDVAATGTFHARAFFVRRARRLVPQSGLVLAATMLAGLVILPSTAWERLGGDTLASALQFENWRLVATKTDYLHPSQGPSVLQNFWSLSVEWQAYLVWALVIGLLVASIGGRRRATLALLVTVTVGSLAASILLSSSQPSLAYFGTPTRLWEFGAGALVSIWAPVIGRRVLREVLGWAGIAAILAASVLFDATTPFPGVAAALPVAGAAAILVAGERRAPSSWSWLLSRAGPVYLGDRSYAIYLWHWPLLLLIEQVMGRPGGAQVAVITGAMTLVLAIVSTRLVERPVRASGRPRRMAVAIVIWMLLPLVLGGGAVVQAATARSTLSVPSDAAHPGAAALGAPSATASSGATTGAPLVPSPKVAAADYGPAGTDDYCLHVVATPVSCDFGDLTSSRLVVLTGDSHAWQWIPALDLIGKRAGFRVETLVRPSCPLAATGVDIPGGIGDDGTCALWRAATVARIVSEHPMAVIVGGLTPQGYEVIDYHVKPFAGFVAGYRATWKVFAAAGIPVVAMRDDPYFSRDIPPCVASNPTYPASCDEPRTTVLGAYPDPLVSATAPGVRLIDLTDSICQPTICQAVVGNVLVYRDRDHLTATYVRTLVPMLWTQLARAAPFDTLPIG